MRIQFGSARSHMMPIGFDAHRRNHLQRWFRCTLAFDPPASRVDHVGNYPRSCVMKSGSASANLVWLARPSHLIAGALRAGKGRSSGSND